LGQEQQQAKSGELEWAVVVAEAPSEREQAVALVLLE